MSKQNYRHIAIVICTSICGLLIGSGCASSLLLHPRATYTLAETDFIKPDLQPFERFHIDTRQGKLELVYWDMRGGAALLEKTQLSDPNTQEKLPASFVLMNVGNAMLAQDAGKWAKTLYGGRDIGVIAWNYPGYGSSTGPLSLERTLKSTVEVYDYLKRRLGDRPIIVHGISIGTCLSIHLAAQRELAAVIVEGPPRIHCIVRQVRFGWWNLWIVSGIVACQIPPAYDPLNSIARVKSSTPILVIVGEWDNLALPEYGNQIYNAWPGKNKHLVNLKQVGHCPEPIELRATEYRNAVDGFIQKVLH